MNFSNNCLTNLKRRYARTDVGFLREQDKDKIIQPSFIERYIEVPHSFVVQNFKLNGKFFRKVGLLYLLHESASSNLRNKNSKELFLKRAMDYESLRNYLILSNQGLIYSAVFYAKGECHHYEDFVSDCMVSYIRSIDLFNPFKGFNFSSYLYRILLRRISRDKKSIGRRSKFEVLESDLEKDNFRLLEVSGTKVALLSDITSDYSEKLRHILKEEKILDEREEYIIRRRFLSEDKGSYRKIGRELKLSKETVRRVESNALIKLRSQLEYYFLSN